MCLDEISKKNHRLSDEQKCFKVVRVRGNDFYNHYRTFEGLEDNKSENAKIEFDREYDAVGDTIHSRYSRCRYPAGFHAYLDKEDALAESAHHKGSQVVEVICKDILCVGKNDTMDKDFTVVSKKIIFLKP